MLQEEGVGVQGGVSLGPAYTDNVATTKRQESPTYAGRSSMHKLVSVSSLPCCHHTRCLEGRLALLNPVVSAQQLGPGVVDAPVGAVTIAFLNVVGAQVRVVGCREGPEGCVWGGEWCGILGHR